MKKLGLLLVLLLPIRALAGHGKVAPDLPKNAVGVDSSIVDPSTRMTYTDQYDVFTIGHRDWR